MIAIRYTAPRELEVEGDARGLEFIGHLVSEICSSPGDSVRFPAQPLADPFPYEKSLQLLRVRVVDGLLRILVLGQHLVLTGRPDALRAFAGALQSLAAREPGSQVRFEYHDGHPGIDPHAPHGRVAPVTAPTETRDRQAHGQRRHLGGRPRCRH